MYWYEKENGDLLQFEKDCFLRFIFRQRLYRNWLAVKKWHYQVILRIL